MKKRKKIILIISILFVVILFIPWPMSPLRDGGTKMYFALAYKVVDWRPLCSTVYGDPIQYRATRIYWFPNNLKQYEELFAMEKAREDFPAYIR